MTEEPVWRSPCFSSRRGSPTCMKCHRCSGRSVRPVSVCTIAVALTSVSPRDKVSHAAYAPPAIARSHRAHSIGKSGPRSIITKPHEKRLAPHKPHMA